MTPVQIERATVEDTEKVLKSVYKTLFGTPPLQDHSDWLDGILTPEQERHSRFIKLLEVKAFETAAMMLISEDCHTSFALQDRHSRVWNWKLSFGYGQKVTGIAANAALAIALACLRKHKGQFDVRFRNKSIPNQRNDQTT